MLNPQRLYHAKLPHLFRLARYVGRGKAPKRKRLEPAFVYRNRIVAFILRRCM